jgi:hypothetical protein
MPAVIEIFLRQPGTGDEDFVRQIIFNQTEYLIELFSSSNISGGYVGITDYLIPLFEDFFN